MDYTTEPIFRNALNNKTLADPFGVQRLITAASRAVDHICTGSVEEGATDYFQRADVVDELLRGQIDIHNTLICYPHKSLINSVVSLSWRTRPNTEWKSVDTNLLVVDSPRIEGWLNTASVRGSVFVKVSYNGGHAVEQKDLVGDLVELVTMLAIRYFREDESGLTDAIGIAELGTLTYTQALPERFRVGIQPFMRRVPW